MNFFDLVSDYVKRVPLGRVSTYGQIAALAGSPRSARAVGWALHRLPTEKLRYVPWHRVVNREGRVSTTCLEHTGFDQVRLLKKEGIRVKYIDGNYFVDLRKYLWEP
ncbi:MAG: MGMT family protein [Candidatus Doudnabacteria bacterium]|nr:MGMT family protein [Candidatus Doudnabacteria bacterium]